MLEKIQAYVVAASLVSLTALMLWPILRFAFIRLRQQGILFALIGSGFLVSMATKPEPSLQIDTESLENAIEGVAYEQVLSASGGTTPYRWCEDDGSSLPEGMRLSEEGILSGTAAVTGTYAVVVRVTDSQSLSETKRFPLVVTAAERPPVTYTIHFDGNGAWEGDVPQDVTLASDTEFVLPESGLTRGVAQFIGWATNATDVARYQPGDAVKGLASEGGSTVTLYAVWENVFELSFDPNGGEACDPAAVRMTANESASLPTAVPVRSGFKFLGWALSETGDALYQPGGDYAAGEIGVCATLYALWGDFGGYTVRFEGNSAWATNVPDALVVAYGTKPTLPESVPTREGWTFTGWTNALNARIYRPGDVFDENCEEGQVFTLCAGWTEATLDECLWTDARGWTWRYRRVGDAITLTEVDPNFDETAKSEVPDLISGGTVTNAGTFDPQVDCADGLWWRYCRSEDGVRIVRLESAVPAELVLPESLGDGRVVGFLTEAMFCNLPVLRSVSIPGTFADLGRRHFGSCTNLEQVLVGEGVECMDGCFTNCPALREIDFPKSFVGLKGSDNFACGTGSEDRDCDANGFRYADTAHRYAIALDPAAGGTVEIPEGVTCVGRALRGNVTMTSCRIPAGLTLAADMFLGCTLAEVDLPGSVTPEDAVEAECTAGTSTITHAIVRGAPPGWDLGTYFTALGTISYDPEYEAEWADYRAAHPSYAYVQSDPACYEATVGHYLRVDLTDDLGVAFDADTSAGDKVTVKIEGLAKGLKLVQDKTGSGTWTIEGVPTETVDFATQAMYARVTVSYKDKTKGRVETLWPLKLEIRAATVVTFADALLSSNYEANVKALWPEADATWSFKGWPVGIKYTAKDIPARGKESAHAAFTAYGCPTKTGVFTVTASHAKLVGKVKYTETEKATITVLKSDGERPESVVPENDGFLGSIDWTVANSAVTVAQGVIQTNWNVTVSADAKVTASGLPSGLKLLRGKDGTYALSGTPTATGNYVVTFKTVQNGVTKVERIAMVVEANPYVGEHYALRCDLEDDVVSRTAVITVAAGGTVKLILTEGTTNVTEKDVVQSRIAKTTVTAKNLDGNGRTATLTLPRDTKTVGSRDRVCVIDFSENALRIDGVRAMSLARRQLAEWMPAVTTIVAEEFASDEYGEMTNCFAYMTATYDAKSGRIGVAGKLWDGTAVKATTYSLEEGCVAPFLVTDKSKNSISFELRYDGVAGDDGETCFRDVACTVCVNGRVMHVGETGTNPWNAGFQKAASVKDEKFTAEEVVVLVSDDSVDASGFRHSIEKVLSIPQKLRAPKLSAQGLVTLKLTDEDGWSWVCELLPIGRDDDENTLFRGIATGTGTDPDTRKKMTVRYPVWSK